MVLFFVDRHIGDELRKKGLRETSEGTSAARQWIVVAKRGVK